MIEGPTRSPAAQGVEVFLDIAEWREEQIKEIRTNWESAYSGASNSFKTAIMYGDWKFTPTSSTNQDTQLLQTRQQQIEEICRAFRVMPIMIGYQGDKSSTYASAEQMFLAHIVHTLSPWYARIEQSAARALLTPQERDGGMYFKHFVQGMMRGSMTERVAYYTAMYNMAAISPNEIRALEDMNPHDDGDDYMAPMNMAKPGEQQTPTPGGAPPGGPSGAAGSSQQRRTAGEGKRLGFESPRSIAEPSALRGEVESAHNGLLSANAAARVVLANLMVKAAVWREEDHPRDDAGRFAGAGGVDKGSAADAFDPREIETNRTPAWKGREKLVEMRIDDFLALAKPGDDPGKEEGVRKLREAGARFSTLPFLQFWGDSESVERKVDGHEGRHRARQLKAEGYSTMPVLLRGDIRWSEQNDPRRFDYRQVWPTTLRSETGAYTLPFPVLRDEANWPYNGDGRVKSDGRKGEWIEADHPREPAGSSEGGQFTSGGGGKPRKPSLEDSTSRYVRAHKDKLLNRLKTTVDELADHGVWNEFWLPDFPADERAFGDLLSLEETVEYAETALGVVKDLESKGVVFGDRLRPSFALSNQVANEGGGAYDRNTESVHMDSRKNVEDALREGKVVDRFSNTFTSHCQSYEDVVRHEIGHYVGMRNGNPTTREIRKHLDDEIKAARRSSAGKMLSPTVIAREIISREAKVLGAYAQTMPEEFFAEAFSYRHAKHYQPNKLPAYIETLIDQAGKGTLR